ncbi:hypothetical protein [Azotobacter chroococcum]|uniref:hypothetical protein n=1 Tax=Azotobacter chroococcum TaxID=353 RepID=UPI0010AEC6B8|nr:hypothetical protein [Azotobacter chroococcum]TKD46651.1 hypothetical protein FCG41_01535 [Azotobacter chroococcum]
MLDIDGLVYHTNTFSWSIVADERTAVITWYTFAATTPSAETGSGSLDGFTLYFGEDSNGNFMALGGNASTTTTSTSNQFNSASITLLRDPVTGLLIDSGSYSGYYGVLDESLTVNVNQSRIIETLELGKVHWYAPANKECGYLRGVALVAGLRVLSPAYAARSLGIDLSNFSSRTGATPLTVVDGVQLIVAKASSGSSRFLLTDAPAFWGEGA